MAVKKQHKKQKKIYLQKRAVEQIWPACDLDESIYPVTTKGTTNKFKATFAFYQGHKKISMYQYLI